MFNLECKQGHKYLFSDDHIVLLDNEIELKLDIYDLNYK